MDRLESLEQRRRELRVAWVACLLAAAGWAAVLLPDSSRPRPEWVRADQTEATRLLFGETLDLNEASAEELEVLPGVGPTRAQAIVLEREREPFGAVQELQAVPGIGPRTVEGLAGWVHVAPPLPDR